MRYLWLPLLALAIGTGCDGDDTTDTDDSEDTDDSGDSGDTGTPAADVPDGTYAACDGSDASDLATSCASTGYIQVIMEDGSGWQTGEGTCTKASMEWDDDDLTTTMCGPSSAMKQEHDWEVQEDGGETYLILTGEQGGGTTIIYHRTADAPADDATCQAETKVEDLTCDPAYVSPGPADIPTAYGETWQLCGGDNITDDNSIKTSCISKNQAYLEMNPTNGDVGTYLPFLCTTAKGLVEDTTPQDQMLTMWHTEPGIESVIYSKTEIKEIDGSKYLIMKTMDDSDHELYIEGGTDPEDVCPGGDTGSMP